MQTRSYHRIFTLGSSGSVEFVPGPVIFSDEELTSDQTWETESEFFSLQASRPDHQSDLSRIFRFQIFEKPKPEDISNPELQFFGPEE